MSERQKGSSVYGLAAVMEMVVALVGRLEPAIDTGQGIHHGIHTLM